MFQALLFDLPKPAAQAGARITSMVVGARAANVRILDVIESDGAPKLNGKRIVCDGHAMEGSDLVPVSSHHPIDDIEPLPEKEPSQKLLLQRECLRWHCGYRDGSLAEIAREFGVSRSIVSRYAKQIADHVGVPSARSEVTAERCRRAQLSRRK